MYSQAKSNLSVMQVNNNIMSPIDQINKAEHLSDKYSLINTRRLIDIAENQGFNVASTKYPKGKNSGHGLHLVRLDLPGHELKAKGEHKPQVIIQNAHNGTSSIRILAGVFRLICSNGLVAGDTSLNIRLRHVGLIQQEVEEAFKIAASRVENMYNKVEAFQTKELTDLDKQRFIIEALTLRAITANLSDTETERLIKSERNQQLLGRVTRLQDKGNSLWNVFNRVQEHSTRASGLQYLGDDSEFHRLHSVNQIQANTKLNQQLWELAEQFAA